MSWDGDKRQRRRLVVWLVVTLCVLAELVGVGLLRASGANGLTAPIISPIGLPADPARERSATFMFTYDRTVAFECTLDGAATAACGLGLFGSRTYPGPLALGRHTFEVRAVTDTETSSPASYSWTIAVPSADGDTPGTSGSGSGDSDAGSSGDGGSSTEEPASFEIAGDVDGLAPGITKPIVLTLRNPNAAPIYVTAVAVDIADDSTPPGCASAPNIALEQPSGITASSPVLVPGHGTVVLGHRPEAPQISFLNRSWNQDVCKGKSFELAYSGSAHS